MSGFERALLEGKERDELSKIAESLGRKPPARMKKADMVDLILELAGVTPTADPAPSGAADQPDEGDATADAAAEEAEADSGTAFAQGDGEVTADRRFADAPLTRSDDDDIAHTRDGPFIDF